MQIVTAIITCILNHRGIHILNYIDDFGKVASTKEESLLYFDQLQATLDALGLVVAKHKASPPS